MRSSLVLALLSLSVPAAADPAPPTRNADAATMHTDDCARARKQNKTCVIDMGKADDITGEKPFATGSSVGLLDFGKAGSLIRIRRDFIVEILKSAEDL